MAIERKFVAQNIKEFRIKEFVGTLLSRVGLSDIKLQRTPMGDKILIKASRPGLVVGRAGSNIQKLTEALKTEFNLENPQIEIEEVEKVGLDADIIAEMIVNSLERFGSQRFKGVGHKSIAEVMNAGALGVEILISGKIPSQRARTWRFYQGYLKKCGDVSVSGVNVAYRAAVLKTGAVGIKVSIMPPTTLLPDTIKVHEATEPVVEEVKSGKEKEELEAVVAAVEEAEKVTAEKKPAKKSAPKKKAVKTEEKPAAEKKAAPAKEAEPKPAAKPAVEAKAESPVSQTPVEEKKAEVAEPATSEDVKEAKE